MITPFQDIEFMMPNVHLYSDFHVFFQCVTAPEEFERQKSSLLLSEKDQVSSVLQHLRSTPVEQKVIRKLKASKKTKNPVLSMAARHEEVISCLASGYEIGSADWHASAMQLIVQYNYHAY